MNHWINKARKISKLDKQFNFIAFTFNKKGKLLSYGENISKTHPKHTEFAKKAGTEYRQTLHAETHAIIKAKAPIYKIIIIRFNKKGQTLLAKPCPVCEIAIREAEIKIVEYTL